MCIESKDHQKKVTRKQEYVEETDNLRHKEEVKNHLWKTQGNRKLIFADAKEKHGMR
jgi:hypothetical protein